MGAEFATISMGEAMNLVEEAPNFALEAGNFGVEAGNSAVQAGNFAANFAEELTLMSEHFFVAADSTDEIAMEETVVVDPNVDNLEFVTRFLTLPIVAREVITSRRQNPILDFTKLVMLTSYQYMNATIEVRYARLVVATKKERNR